MPFQKLVFKPGVNRDTTNYANEGGWYECDKIRFYSGYPQKLGGWIKYTSETFLGTCRQMWNWVTSYADNFLALGTNKKVYIEVGGYYYDITPTRESFTSTDTDNCVSTTNGSPVATFSIAVAHNCNTGDYVKVSGVTGNVGGIPDAELNTTHEITVTSSTAFTVTVATNATSTVAAGGGTAIQLDCQIHPGYPAPTEGYGWGTDAWQGDNIEPALSPSATDDCITTVSGSAVATFAVVSHGLTDGDSVTISGVTGNVGGIPDEYFVGSTDGTNPLNGNHTITYVDADTFTITVGVSATSSATGGGTNIYIERHVAETSSTFGWGLATNVPIYLPQQDWFFDNFENDLVMNIRAVQSGGYRTGGPIYYWSRGTNPTPVSALATQAVALSTLSGAANVPESATQILVSQNDKHLLAFGCQPYGGSTGEFDPLLIRWASQNDPQFWTVTTANAPSGFPSTAGFIRVSRGSRIVRAIPTRQEIAVFTDTHLYSLQYTGTTEVFALQELADGVSIMGPRTVAVGNNAVFWMGLDKFYMYDGRVQTLPCTLRQYVFEDINKSLSNSIIVGNNERFNEIWWFYPSGASSWNDRYVVYNYGENIWYYGQLGRTAWLDAVSRDLPIGIYTSENQDPGQAYLHEYGVNADEEPMESFIQSSDFDIGDGENFMLSRRVIPDINFTSSTAATPEIDLEIRSRNFPGSNFQNDPSDSKSIVRSTVNNFTDQVYIRARGRQMALKIASDTLGVQWQLGDTRIDTRPDGKR